MTTQPTFRDLPGIDPDDLEEFEMILFETQDIANDLSYGPEEREAAEATLSLFRKGTPSEQLMLLILLQHAINS